MITGIELWKKIDKQITDHPETHYQGSWEADYCNFSEARSDGVEMCGTTRCLAGWAIAFNARPGEILHETRNRIAKELSVPYGADSLYISVGAELLGITLDHARVLFLELDEALIARIVHEYATGES